MKNDLLGAENYDGEITTGRKTINCPVTGDTTKASDLVI